LCAEAQVKLHKDGSAEIEGILPMSSRAVEMKLKAKGA